MSDGTQQRGLDVPGLLIAVFLFALAATLAINAASMQLSPVYARVGPQAVPYVIAAGLVLLGIGTLIAALRGEFPRRESCDWTSVLTIVGGFVALIALIGLGGGFIVATAVLFAATARAFGRRALVADAMIGFGIGVLIYLIFAKLLTLTLPEGPLERLITSLFR